MTENICFRVTTDQKDFLLKRAKRSNMNLAEYARDMVVNSDDYYMSGYWAGVEEERKGIVDES